MAIGLQNYPNIDNSDPANYPYGALKDNPGDDSGTPVNRVTNNDIHQFFAWLLAGAGVTPNGNPDNVTNGLQLITSLPLFIRNLVFATEAAQGVAELATQAETLAGVDDARIVTPLKLAQFYTAFFNQVWVSRTAVGDVSVSGGSGITVTLYRMKYKVIGKTIHVLFMAQITNTTAPTSFTLTIPGGFSYNGGFAVSHPCTVVDGSANIMTSRIVLNNATPTVIQVSLLTGQSLTNTEITTINGAISFEIA